MAREKIDEGRFALDVTRLGEKTETWDHARRTVELVDGNVVVTRHQDHGGEPTTTILPPGTAVTIKNKS